MPTTSCTENNTTRGTDPRAAINGSLRRRQHQEKFTATTARWNNNDKTGSDDVSVSVRPAVGGYF